MKDKLHNVLAFPDGGWMVDAVPYTEWELDDLETEELNLRKQQMESLRQLCIPKVNWKKCYYRAARAKS